jgi:hypothetical protein
MAGEEQFNQDEVNKYMEASGGNGQPIDNNLGKDLLQLQLEITRLRSKIYNIMWNKIPNPAKSGELLVLGEPLLTKEGIDHLMVILDTSLDPNTLLTGISKEQVYDILMIIMQSVGNSLVFNPQWQVLTFDNFDAIYDAISICLLLTLNRCVEFMTLKTINDRYQQKMLMQPQGNYGGRYDQY